MAKDAAREMRGITVSNKHRSIITGGNYTARYTATLQLLVYRNARAETAPEMADCGAATSESRILLSGSARQNESLFRSNGTHVFVLLGFRSDGISFQWDGALQRVAY